ncbi:iron-sulfur cluster carrier protein [Halolactibacillus miurensis]|uniref:Iron-sulfur cluster carrier protein n=2 Tax=Halolactibacillus miurensis TaxID=306541 RepID=A0A1I6TT29_9BACI|nr:iron-sulfur cluster carrier protein [Halolactibacillus miurensis]SFS92228.1 ATP-binding protein involved in chromosome partitioning [Halolactibacillus miurensis]
MKKQQVMTILRPVQDPFIHKRFVETDAIKLVEVDETTGKVTIELALSQLNQPENDRLKKELTNKLIQAGASDVAIHFTQLPEEQLKKYPQYQVMMSPLLNGEAKTTFLAIASGKGGVGKSTITANLAANLARLGKKVGIIDADIYGFSIPHMMGVTKKPTLQGNKIIPVEAHGVKIMSMDFFVEGNDPVIWRGPRLGKMLNSFFIEVDWGELDYLLLDLPPGTGDMALNVHTTLPTSKEIIVTTPHETAAHVASRAGKMARNTNHEIVGVVENMSYFESQTTHEREYIFGKGGGEWLAKELTAPLLAEIPLGQPNNDNTGSIYAKDEVIGKIYYQMAEVVINEIENK